MRAWFAIFSILTLTGCSSTAPVVEKEFSATIQKPKVVKQQRNIISKSDVCEFSVSTPEGQKIAYRGVASDKGNWRGATPFSACMALKDGDTVKVSRINIVRTTNFFGNESKETTNSYWQWTFGDTIGRFL